MSEKPPETEVPTDQPIDSALTADQNSGEEVHLEPSPVDEVEAEVAEKVVEETADTAEVKDEVSEEVP